MAGFPSKFKETGQINEGWKISIPQKDIIHETASGN